MRMLYLLAALCLTAACDNRPKLVREAEEAVRSQLRDPTSAKFEDVSLCEKPDIVSGKVNAKNAFGGMTGFQLFIYGSGRVALANPEALARDPMPGEFNELAAECFRALNEGSS